MLTLISDIGKIVGLAFFVIGTMYFVEGVTTLEPHRLIEGWMRLF